MPTTSNHNTAPAFNLNHAPAPENTGLARLADSYKLHIAGSNVDAASGATFDTINPATGGVLAAVAHAGHEDVEQAVRAARDAQQAWAATPGAVRGRYLFRIARRIAERSRELAVVETLNGGKPIRETRDFDVPTAAQHFFYHAGWADKLDWVGLGPNPQPVGVCAAIVPWNFPLLMAAWKVAPALAAGNTVVLKPAETTPLTALILAEIAAEAGLPAGVLNVVTGPGDVGAALVEHPDVDKVAFTGSTAVGRGIAERIAGTNKRATLELGGKSANIVYSDASLDAAVEGAVAGIFFNQGHVCSAGSRLLVQEPVHDEFLARLLARVETIRVGDPLDKNTDMGAINSAAQLNRIRRSVEQAANSAATIHVARRPIPGGDGYWFPPTVIDGVSPADPIARREVFGPVLAVMTFRTPTEAVTLANDSTYGLAAGIWSQNPARIRWTASQLRAGVIWENTYNKFDPTSPFGGFRESGYGREGGRSGMEAYLV